MARYTLDLSLVDTCAPDYLTDHHNREGEQLIGLPMSEPRTYESIANELYEAWTADFSELPDDITEQQYRDQIADLFNIPGWNKHAFFAEGLHGEDVQAWFLLRWEELDPDVVLNSEPADDEALIERFTMHGFAHSVVWAERVPGYGYRWRFEMADHDPEINPWLGWFTSYGACVDSAMDPHNTGNPIPYCWL